MKLKIDLTNPNHVVAAAAFFNSLAGVVPGETLTIEPEPKKAMLSSEDDLKKGRAKRTKTTTATKLTAQDSDTTRGTVEEKIMGSAVGEEIIVQGKNTTGAELKEGEAVALNEEGEAVALNEEGEAVALNEEGEVSLEFLQSSVSGLTKKSKENVPPLRDKLIELGAKRVSSLTTDKYQEFYNFLEPLLIEFKLKTLDNAGA